MIPVDTPFRTSIEEPKIRQSKDKEQASADQ